MSMFEQIPGYFSESEKKQLAAIQGETLERVFYTVWKNLSAHGEGFESLDWVELFFSENVHLTIHAGENSSGITIKPLNYGFEQTRVFRQFQGQVVLDRIDMSSSPVWVSLLGKKVISVGLEEHDHGQFANHIIQLGFEEKRVEIRMDEEGLWVF
ncbi:MAG: hypothetical protein SF052_08015 [Bacteroidia bacterium]|nr:hypothetical protein [Bacteroidia bacterium]